MVTSHAADADERAAAAALCFFGASPELGGSLQAESAAMKAPARVSAENEKRSMEALRRTHLEHATTALGSTTVFGMRLPSPMRLLRSRPVKLGLGALGLLLLVMVVRAETMPSRQLAVTPLTGDAPVDANVVGQRLGALIRKKTVSESDGKAPRQELDALRAWLEATYPRTHAELGHAETFVDDSQIGQLLYTWKPKAPSNKAPIILIAHLDVVPVDGDPKTWTHPPFEGEVADGFVWGRGALDDKLAVVGIFEAIESLLSQEFSPDRTVYVALGEDEEISGTHGASKIAAALKAQGVQAELALDEGGAITQGIIPGVTADVATIAIAEKGYLTLDLGVDMTGGHSSTPRPETAVTVLTRATTRLSENKLPAHLDTETVPWIPFIAPEQSFGMKVALANLWLTRPLVERTLGKKPASDATMRTTTAVTGITTGVKDNVIPAHASAVVNFRVLPGQTTQGVTEEVRALIADDRVKIVPREASRTEPSPMSSTTSAGYDLVARTIRELDDHILVMPIVTLGATDGRYYTGVARDVYRFTPAHLTGDDLARIHGKDERASLTDVSLAVRFYRQFLRNACTGK
jgi:carboxypeptidase PM20D1